MATAVASAQDTVRGAPTGSQPSKWSATWTGALASLRPVSATCSRPGCQRAPTATLTYDYAGSVATIDQLSDPHPMQYDLCEQHTERLSVPMGWTLVDRRVLAPVLDLGDRRAS